MSEMNNMTFPDEPQGRSIARAGATEAAAIVVQDGTTKLAGVDAKSPHTETSDQSVIFNGMGIAEASTEPEIKAGEYDCDLVKEYERSNRHCFLLLEDCKVELLDELVELFLTAAKDEEIIISFQQEKVHCWNCKSSCGQNLIRTASLDERRSIVQVHRCCGCCYGTHMMRQKLFQYLNASQRVDGQSPTLLSFAKSVQRVPFNFLECTAAMRQEFQERCRSLLGSDHPDRRELAKQALFGQQHP